jgi:predicted ribonuclease YlaK
MGHRAMIVTSHEQYPEEFFEQYDSDQQAKGQKKKNKRKEARSSQNHSLKLRDINPRTTAQSEAFDCYRDDNNIILHGCAGTGKTFLSLYLALDEIFNDNIDNKQKITVFRSIVPTRDIGFLPGTEKEKAKVYEAPYTAIVNDLFGRGDAYSILKGKQILDFETTSFIRGMTFDDTIMIVDECQNLTFHELDSIITRVGVNSKILFCGDFNQSDFAGKRENSGIVQFMDILDHMKNFDHVEFKKGDIVRSGLVKDYICTKIDRGYE